ncbi:MULTISPECIES: hypothetical protein [unclassified Pseudoclavibacter]|uniref:hypothetical protein n=1 Tax=unclassified Pseudoclavibacter TaxID=2615177 RepID=UPI001BA6A126|nr:hypothetical protein [Pseudoclavibacter sp. Marseille-Q4354]MBS3177219.1 hypothetical protein [Pseudoclavibacter sp. Marseille-Q4354]
MSRRYRKAVEQYLTTHAPTALKRSNDPKQLINTYAAEIADAVRDDVDFVAVNNLERPTRELRTRVERVVFPVIMTRVAPPELEKAKGIVEAETFYVALSDTITSVPTPMRLRAMEAYDTFRWDTNQPVFLVSGEVATSREQIDQDHQLQRAALQQLRQLDGQSLADTEDLITAALGRDGAKGPWGSATWAGTVRVMTQEIAAGTFETPSTPPQLVRSELEEAGESEMYAGRNEVGDRFRLRTHLYNLANPGQEIAERMPDALRATTAATLDYDFVQYTVQTFQRDADPATRAAVSVLQTIRPERVEQLRDLIRYEHVAPGADHQRLSTAKLLESIKEEIDGNTFTAPRQRPHTPAFGDHHGHLDNDERDEYWERAAVGYARDMFRADAYERSTARPNDIHATASMPRPASSEAVAGPSL